MQACISTLYAKVYSFLLNLNFGYFYFIQLDTLVWCITFIFPNWNYFYLVGCITLI